MPDPNEKSPEEVVRQIRRVTRKKYSAEDKMRIVLEGLRGTTPIQELCRREGIAANLYYTWSKEFIEAGKQRLRGDTERQADTSDVKDVLDRDHSTSLNLLRRVGHADWGFARGVHYAMQQSLGEHLRYKGVIGIMNADL